MSETPATFGFIQTFAPQPAELLHWHATAARMPDSDLTALLWLVYDDGTADWCPGWWDGDAWRDATSGGVIDAEVTHWAQPGGPAC